MEVEIKKRIWKGVMGGLMGKHLRLRAAVGRVAQADGYVLHRLNKFLCQKYPSAKTLNRMIILDFLRTMPKLTIGGRRNYIIHIRQFCRFLNQRGIACYVPDKTMMPKYQYKPRYCPLTEMQVKDFMQMARAIGPKRPFVGETYATILGLLWCTGMRRREVVRLTHEDVDLVSGIIYVRQTKFNKDRMLPLSRSVIKSLKKYQSKKAETGYAIASKSAFFVNFEGDHIPGHSVSTMFNRLVDKTEIKNAEGRQPCVHDFRHNFATQNMGKFFKDPERYPPGPSLARLSTYLGHTCLFHTQYYLHPDFDLMQAASKKFEVIR